MSRRILLTFARDGRAGDSKENAYEIPPRLTFPNFYQNKPTLIIGHHLLEGKIATLSKPLAVLLRSTPVSQSSSSFHDHDRDCDDEDGDAMMDTDPDSRVTKGATGWDIVAVVKRKIVFSKRQMPIISAPALVTNSKS